jgi:CheY-like chemotaxis protein
MESRGGIARFIMATIDTMGKAVIDAEAFEEMVHSALNHLYDHAYLLRHPLARVVDGSSPTDFRANSLRRLLLDAIQDLKPPREVSTDSPAWRHYQYLYLRYVEAKPVTEIARGLAVSDRQTRRRHRDALEALCRILRERLRGRLAVSDRPELTDEASVDQSTPLGSAAAADLLLESELRLIQANQDEALVDVRAEIDGVLETVASLARTRGGRLRLTGSGSVFILGDRIVFRTALLSALVFAIGDDATNGVEVDVGSEGDWVKILIRVCRPSNGFENVPSHGMPTQLAEADRLLRTQRGSILGSTTTSATTIEISVPLARQTTVLVVDDNPDMRGLFRRYLAGTNYRAILVSSGDEAMPLARETRPDCIILDVMMPRRDGWEILQSLQNDQATRKIPVLICTVLQQAELAGSLGAAGYLAKPITQRSLLAAIDRCRSIRPAAHSDNAAGNA